MEKVTLVLGEKMLAIIAAGLQELPYRVAKPVLEEMQKQVDAQLAAFEAAKKESAGLVGPDGQTPVEVAAQGPRLVKADPAPVEKVTGGPRGGRLGVKMKDIDDEVGP